MRRGLSAPGSECAGARAWRRDSIVDGVRFVRHRAQSSWTKNSMASLWTSLYPERTGILRHDHAVPDEARMPAELLKDAGFATAGIWRNGWVAPNFGFSQGFEIYLSPLTRSSPKDIRRKARAGRIEARALRNCRRRGAGPRPRRRNPHPVPLRGGGRGRGQDGQGSAGRRPGPSLFLRRRCLVDWRAFGDSNGGAFGAGVEAALLLAVCVAVTFGASGTFGAGGGAGAATLGAGATCVGGAFADAGAGAGGGFAAIDGAAGADGLRSLIVPEDGAAGAAIGAIGWNEACGIGIGSALGITIGLA